MIRLKMQKIRNAKNNTRTTRTFGEGGEEAVVISTVDTRINIILALSFFRLINNCSSCCSHALQEPQILRELTRMDTAHKRIITTEENPLRQNSLHYYDSIGCNEYNALQGFI